MTEMNGKALVRTGSTLVDALVVAKAMADDEIEQVLALGGNPNADVVAMTLIQNAAMMWTWRDRVTQEPLAVGGYMRTGAVVYRSFFIANPRVWDEHGRELTESVTETLDEIKKEIGRARLETMCLAERAKARRWYERIGLTFDAELKGYGVNGETVALYSTVAEPSQIEIAQPGDPRIA